jgi:outer membrane protein
MKYNLLGAFWMLLLVAVGAQAQAQNAAPVKIGYASVNYILQAMPEAKQIDQQLQEYEKQLSNQLQTQAQEIQNKYAEYQKAAPTMLPEIRQQKEQELNNLQQQAQEFQRKAQVLVQQKEAALLDPVYTKIQDNIDAVAKENGYSHILNTEVAGVPTLLYVASDGDDISNMVLKKMGVTPPAAEQAGN